MQCFFGYRCIVEDGFVYLNGLVLVGIMIVGLDVIGHIRFRHYDILNKGEN